MLGLGRKESPLGSLTYLNHRSETGRSSLLPEKLMRDRFQAAPTLFRKDLKGHFGCVNAIEFSSHGGEYLASGGDDRRVLVWNTETAISGCAQPAGMKGEHHSNIFCLAFDNSNTKIFSGGNDEQVIVHDVKTGTTLDVFNHEDAVYGLSVDPVNDNVFASACDDGRILIYDIRAPPSEDPFCLANYMAQMHAVVYNPVEPRLLATANSTEGIGLWDVRRPRSCLLRYGGSLSSQSCMSVRINQQGDRLIALRRRLPPVLYDLHSSLPIYQFDHAGYYNSCTMKSCCFAGDNDQYLISGSDDFNLYVWKIPEEPSDVPWVGEAHLVLRGHRSIVNQVRFNPANHLVISSGVEKVIKMWSPFEMPESIVAPYAAPAAQPDPLTTVAEAAAVEASLDERPVYTQEEYYNLLLRSGQVMSHDYSHQSTDEDPRMMAFFDALVQRELEGFSSDDDSLDSSSQIMLQFVQPSDSEVSIVGDNTQSDGSRAASPRPSVIATTDSSAVVSSPGNHGAEPDLDNNDEETEGSSTRSLLNMDELLLATRRARLEGGSTGVQGNINVLNSSSVSVQDRRDAQGSSASPSVASTSTSTHTLPGQRLLPTRPSISELITLKRKEYLSNARKVDQLIRRRHAKRSATKRASTLAKRRLENATSSSSSSSTSSGSSESSTESESSSSDSPDCDNNDQKHAERASQRRAKKRRHKEASSSDSSPERPEGLAAAAVAQLRNSIAERKRSGFQRLKQMRTRSLIRSNGGTNSDDESIGNTSSAASTTERILHTNSNRVHNGNGELLPNSPSRTTLGIPINGVDTLLQSPGGNERLLHFNGSQEPMSNGASTSATHRPSSAHLKPTESSLNNAKCWDGSKDDSNSHLPARTNNNNNNNNHTNDPPTNGFDQASVSGASSKPVFKFKRFSANKERSGRRYRRRTSQDHSSGNEAS